MNYSQDRGNFRWLTVSQCMQGWPWVIDNREVSEINTKNNLRSGKAIVYTSSKHSSSGIL